MYIKKAKTTAIKRYSTYQNRSQEYCHHPLKNTANAISGLQSMQSQVCNQRDLKSRDTAHNGLAKEVLTREEK